MNTSNTILSKKDSFAFLIDDTKVHINSFDLYHNVFSDNTDKITLLQTLHYHNYYEIFFIKHGTLTIATSTENLFFSDCIVIIPPKFYHYSSCDSEDNCIVTVELEEKQNYTQTMGLFAMLEKKSEKNEPFFFSFTPDIDFYTEKIFNIIQFPDSFFQDKLFHLFYLLFFEIFQNACSDFKPKPTHNCMEKESTYASILETIIANEFKNDLSLPYVAEQLHLSERHTSRIICKLYGVPLSQVVMEKRIAIAKQFLKNTSMKVSQIAYQVGFQTENYFYNSFRKICHVTPLQYRKHFNRS